MFRPFCLLVLSVSVAFNAGCRQEEQNLRTYSPARDGETATEDSSVPSPSPASATGAAEDPQPTIARVEGAPAEPELPSSTASSPQPVAPPDSGPAPPDVVSADTARPPRAPLPVRIADSGLDPSTPPAGITSSAPGTQPDGSPREIELLVPHKDFLRVKPDGALRVTYDDLDLLKVLNMEPVPEDAPKHFPLWLSELDGKRVRIRGFMVPPPREDGLSGFILARDNQICCFGRDPKVYDIIPVFLKDGVTTRYIPNRPFDVVGRFFIRPDAYRGELENLYEIEDAVILDE